MADVKPFGKQLKAYRLRRLWTLRQLALVTGFPIPTLSRIENLRTKPQDLTIAKISRALPDFEIAEVA